MSSQFNTFPISADYVVFSGNNSGADGDIHLRAENEDAHLQFDNRIRCIKDIEMATKIADVAGGKIFELSSDKTTITHGKITKYEGTVNFNGQTIQNASGLSGALTTADIASNNGYASADLELDTLTTTLNTTKNRTENLTTNKIMISNNAGLLTAGNYSQTDFLRNNNTAQQEVVGDLNFASGKVVKYNGVSFNSTHLTDSADLTRDDEINTATTTALAGKMATDFSNATGTIADARIPSTITRDTEINTATTTALAGKMATDFSNATGTIADARIPSTITRDADAVLLAGTQAITGVKSFNESTNFGAFSSGAYSYITKTGNVALVNGSGASSVQFNFPTRSLELADNSNNDLEIFGGGLTIPTGKTYQINGTALNSSHLSDGATLATTSQISGKMEADFSNATGTIADARIPSTITRDAEACLLTTTQTIAGDKTFSGETSFTDDVYISNTKTIISSGGGTETEYVASRVGQPSLNSLNAMYTSAPANTQKTIAYTEYTGETIFQGSIGTNPTADTNFCVMDKTGFLALNSGGDSSIRFDDSTTDDSSSTGFKLKNNSGTLDITTDVNLTSGHVFKVGGTQFASGNLSDSATLVKTSGNQTIAGTKTFSNAVVITSDITRTENSTATNYLDKIKELYTSYEKTVTLPASAFVPSTAYKLFDSNDEFDVYEFGVRKGTETINLDDSAFLTSAFKMLLSFQGYTAGAAAGSAYLFDYTGGGGGIHSSLKMMAEIIGHNNYGANDGNAPNTATIPSIISYHISGMENPTLQYEAPSGAPHTFNIVWGSTVVAGTVTGLTNVKIKLIKISDF